MNKKYEEILSRPRKVSDRHAHMSVYDRAAQFAPFAALTGYEEAVSECARLTDRKINLDSDGVEELNYKILDILREGEGCAISVTYFEKDKRKSGGAYITIKGIFRGVDELSGKLIMDSGVKISFEDIIGIEEI